MISMRLVRALGAALVCGGLVAWANGSGEGSPPRELVVVRGPLPAGASATLSRAMALHGEYGGFAVGQATAAEVGKLRQLGFDAVALGAWPAGRQLVVARADHAPAGATLFAAAGGVLVELPAGAAPPPASCHSLSIVSS
ncbi:MAG TPA: hypothetical protein VFF36_04055, partial [Planctomycetota bacterium]|nr:hypothetical protein [Planctomycetota bacterium]